MLVRDFLSSSQVVIDPKSNNPVHYVDQASLAFAINTFGPWKLAPGFINTQFNDMMQATLPMSFFHGPISKEKSDKLLLSCRDEKFFLLRYADSGEGILLCYTMFDNGGNLSVRETKLTRKKPYSVRETKNSKKKKSYPASWAYEESVADFGTTKIKHKHSTLGKFLNGMRGSGGRSAWEGCIEKPVLAHSAYDRVAVDDIERDNINHVALTSLVEQKMNQTLFT